MKTKIICFIASLSSGGAEHQLSMLANFLSVENYDVTLLTYGDAEDHYELNDRINRIKIAQKKSKIKKILSLFKFVITTKAECIISFGARENFMLLIPLLFNRSVKMIAGERCVIWDGLKWYNKMNYKFLYSRADYIVPNSKTQENDIKVNWPKLANKTKAIFNYTAIDEICMSPLPNRDFIKVGIFSRYSKQKNYIRFSSVVKTLKEKCNKRFEFHWYGNKHNDQGMYLEEYNQFSKMIDEYKIDDVLKLHDHVKDAVSLFDDYDVLSLPSLTEGFSNALSEYICSGHPVVASDVADNSIMVHDGENGFLFNPEDEEDMVKTYIDMFNTSYSRRCEMGKKSRMFAERLFCKETFVKSYVEIIEH